MQEMAFFSAAKKCGYIASILDSRRVETPINHAHHLVLIASLPVFRPSYGEIVKTRLVVKKKHCRTSSCYAVNCQDYACLLNVFPFSRPLFQYRPASPSTHLPFEVFRPSCVVIRPHTPDAVCQPPPSRLPFSFFPGFALPRHLLSKCSEPDKMYRMAWT